MYTSTLKTLSKNGVVVGTWIQFFEQEKLDYFCRILNGEELPVRCPYSIERGDIIVGCGKMAMILMTDVSLVGEICLALNRAYYRYRDSKTKNPTDE